MLVYGDHNLRNPPMEDSMCQAALFMMLVLVGLAPISASAQEDRHADHEALQEILKTSKEALNSKNFDLLKPILAKEHFTIITVDNQKFTSLEAFEKHWDMLLKGNDAVLEDIKIDPVADSATEFLTDNVGVVDGTSNETYHFKDGDVRTMQTRWTAVVKQEDGAWKIVKVHFSSNLLDNPVLNAAKQAAERYVLMAAIAGFAVGALIMGFLRRRKAA